MTKPAVTIAGVEAGVILALQAEGLTAAQIADLFANRAGSGSRHLTYRCGAIETKLTTTRHVDHIRKGWICVGVPDEAGERAHAEARIPAPRPYLAPREDRR